MNWLTQKHATRSCVRTPPKPGSRRPFGSLCFVLEPSSPSKKDSICPRKLGSALLLHQAPNSFKETTLSLQDEADKLCSLWAGRHYLGMGTWRWGSDGRPDRGCTMHDTTTLRRLCIVSFFKPSLCRLLLPPPVPAFPLPPSLLSPIAPPTISSHHDAACQWSMVNGLAADMTGLAATTCSYLGIVAAREKSGLSSSGPGTVAGSITHNATSKEKNSRV